MSHNGANPPRVKSENHFRSLFETMHEGFAYHEVICNDGGEPVDYRYLDINPAFEQLTGLKRETTVGRTVREVLPGIEEEWIQCFGNVALTGIPDERESYVQDLDRYYRSRAYSPEKGKFAVVFEETTAQRRAQRELERREALYNDLVETATDLVWRCDSEGRYTFLNQAWETVFGYSRSEMLGHRFTDFMTSEQAERDSALFAHLLSTTGQVTDYETIHLHKDRTPVYLVFNARFYHDDAGQVTGTQGTAHDITALKQTAEALRESERKYRELVQNANSIILKWDRQGRILFMNEYGLKFFGYSETELVGRPVMETIVPDHELSGRDLARLMDDIFASPNQYERNINENICKDGRRVWISWSNNPIIENGVVTGMFSVGSDITAQKTAEELIKERNLFIGSLLKAIPVAVFYKDREGKYLGCNHAFSDVMGVTDEQIRGRTVYELWPGEMAEKYHQMDLELMGSGEQQEYEFAVRDKDGRIRPVIYRKDVFFDIDGNVAGLVGAFIDITERKQTEDSMRQHSLFLTQLMDIAQTYINLPLEQVQATIERSLAGIGTFVDADRAYIFRYDFSKGITTNTHEWCAPDVSTHVDELQAVPLEDIPELVASHIRGETFVIPSVTEMPPSPFSEILATESIKSLICVPLMSGSACIGFAGFDSVRDTRVYSADEQRLLGLYAGMLVNLQIRSDAEKELRYSEDFRKRVFESSKVPMVIMDATTLQYLDCNLAAVDAYGYGSKEETLRKRPLDVSAPVQYDGTPSGEKASFYINEANEKGAVVFEWLHRRPDGKLWDAEVHLLSFSIDDSKMLQFSLFDITERKQAEEALKDSRERTQFIMNNSPAAIYTCRPSGDFAATYISPNVVQQLGYEPHEFTDDPGFWLAHIHPDDAPRVLAGLLTLFSKGTHSHEYRFRNKDGSWRWIHDELKLAQNEAGEPKEILGCWADITVRKQSEEALAHSHQLMRYIIEHTRSAVAIHDHDLRYVYVSQRYLDDYGIKEKNVIGMHHYEVFPDLPQKWRDVHQRALAGEVVSADDDPYYRDDGSVEWTRWECRPWYASDGSIGGIIVYTEVTTERKKAEDERLKLERQLLHAQKLESLGVLAGGIAHDFNNILTAIIGNAELALMRLNPESPALDNLQRIEKAAARAADLARQMLAYSGKGKFVVEHIDLNRLVEEMGHMLEISISKKALLRYNLTKPLPAVKVDATQIRQIIMNLVINASEAIGDRSGVIAITTGCLECNETYLKDAWLTDPLPAGLYVFLEVADTGCGMDKETLSRLFDPFFTTKFTGRGLGMAAVLGIIRGHKGAIKVSSEPGKGSSFKVLLPVGEKSAELFNDIATADHWQGSGTVLLVDDEETVRAIGAEMLKELGFEVITARDGREAVELYKTGKEFSVVILDLTMPHMDGEQCFRELCRIDPDVKVIISSGFSEHDVTQKFVGKELAGYVQKPYKMSELKEVLKRATL